MTDILRRRQMVNRGLPAYGMLRCMVQIFQSLQQRANFRDRFFATIYFANKATADRRRHSRDFHTPPRDARI